MKKILSLGVASAVLSLTAVAASATIYADVSTPVVPGEQVVVEIVADGIDTKGLEFTVEAEGLTFVEAAPAAVGMSNFSAETNGAYWFHTAAPEDGTVLLTLTYTVDAEAGEEVSVTLSGEGVFAQYVNATPVSVEVTDTDEPVEEPTDEPTDEPVDEPTIEEPTDEPTGEPGEEPGEDNGSEEPENPITGVGLAVIPALVAGAAVVASKKRG